MPRPNPKLLRLFLCTLSDTRLTLYFLQCDILLKILQASIQLIMFRLYGFLLSMANCYHRGYGNLSKPALVMGLFVGSAQAKHTNMTFPFCCFNPILVRTEIETRAVKLAFEPFAVLISSLVNDFLRFTTVCIFQSTPHLLLAHLVHRPR